MNANSHSSLRCGDGHESVPASADRTSSTLNLIKTVAGSVGSVASVRRRAAKLVMPVLLCVSAMLVAPAHAGSEWKAYSTAGGQAPAPLSLLDMSGKTIDLASLRGQVVLLNFWATWCEPCRDEMPALNRLHQQLEKRGVRVVGVNLAEGRAKIEQFLKVTPVDFPILRDSDSAVSKTWRVRILPASFLIDRNGMLRYQMVGDADWDDAKIRAPILDLLK